MSNLIFGAPNRRSSSSEQDPFPNIPVIKLPATPEKGHACKFELNNAAIEAMGYDLDQDDNEICYALDFDASADSGQQVNEIFLYKVTDEFPTTNNESSVRKNSSFSDRKLHTIMVKEWPLFDGSSDRYMKLEPVQQSINGNTITLFQLTEVSETANISNSEMVDGGTNMEDGIVPDSEQPANTTAEEVDSPDFF